VRQSNIYTPQKINLNTKLELDQHAAQHLGKVLRAQKGDPVRLFNGDGHFYEALITDVSKKTGQRANRSGD
jgi:16S rRNA (uracil1498-N3)-methyltransferase